MSTADVAAVHDRDSGKPSSPWSSVSAAWGLLKSAAVAWQRDNAMRLSAAVAMYAMLSLAPLLVISIKVTAVILSEQAATAQVQRQVSQFLGPTGAAAVNDMVVHALKPGSGLLATLVSFAILLYTASGVFNELRDSLNAVWEIKQESGGGWWTMVRQRLLSFGMVLVIGFLLLISMVVTSVLTALSEYVLDGGGWAGMLIDLVVSLLIITLLFATLFRVLPDARLSWRDVLYGALATAVLFKLGQYLLALYFTYGSTASAYGAAGSFVVILLWVYYSCWILFFRAELIQEFAKREGRRIQPAENARRTSDAKRDWRTGGQVPRPGEDG